MESNIWHMFLDLLAASFVALLALLLEVDVLREALPGLSRILEEAQDAEDTARRRLTLIFVCYAAVSAVLLCFFKGSSKRNRLKLKVK